MLGKEEEEAAAGVVGEELVAALEGVGVMAAVQEVVMEEVEVEVEAVVEVEGNIEVP